MDAEEPGHLCQRQCGVHQSNLSPIPDCSPLPFFHIAAIRPVGSWRNQDRIPFSRIREGPPKRDPAGGGAFLTEDAVSVQSVPKTSRPLGARFKVWDSNTMVPSATGTGDCEPQLILRRDIAESLSAVLLCGRNSAPQTLDRQGTNNLGSVDAGFVSSNRGCSQHAKYSGPTKARSGNLDETRYCIVQRDRGNARYRC